MRVADVADNARDETEWLMTQHTHKVILITGASSGIGAACATYLAEQGHHVYGTSRRQQSIQTAFNWLQMDVTNEASIRQAVQIMLEREGRLDVVVNNAGIGYAGAVEDTSLAEAYETFETNFFGVLRVCHTVLPTMRAQASGLIINVSSIGGMMGLPYQGLYSASKFAIQGLTEALRMEVKAFGICVVLIEPGDIRTQFTANRRSTRLSGHDSTYAQVYRRALAKIEADERQGAPPEIVAKLMSRIIAHPSPRPRYIVGPFYEKLAVWIKHLLPARFFEWIMMKNYGL